MKAENGWHEVDLRDNRYNQIIHMVSAANGAEDFYTLQGHKTRHEGLDSAREVDAVTANVIICLHLFVYFWFLCVCVLQPCNFEGTIIFRLELKLLFLMQC